MDLPDIFSGDRKIIVMELQVSSDEEGCTSLGSVIVSYDDAEKDLEFISCIF